MSPIQQYLKNFQKTIPSHLRPEATAEVHSHLEELCRETKAVSVLLIDKAGQLITSAGRATPER